MTPSNVVLMMLLVLVGSACGVSDEQAETTLPATTAPPAVTAAATTTSPATNLSATTAPAEVTTTTESAPVDLPVVLLGVWRTPGGVFMTFNDDGTWLTELIVSGGAVSSGAYALEDGVLTLSTDAGGDFCLEGETGIYDVAAVTRDELSVILVSDDCSGRSESQFREPQMIRYGS